MRAEYLEAFYKYMMPVTESGCWIWLGYLDENGYGRFSPKFQMAPLYAHRYSYHIHKGPINKELVIDHLCRNKSCVNPDHLELVTQKENLKRGHNPNLAKTHCKRGHEFSPDNTRLSPRGTRVCRQCELMHGRLKYQRKKHARSS